MDLLYRLGWTGITNVIFMAIAVFFVRAVFILVKKRFVPQLWILVFLSALCPVSLFSLPGSSYMLEALLGVSFKFYFFLLWEAVAVILFFSGLIKCRRRKWKSLDCETVAENVYIMKGLKKASVCGFLHPVIYLPENLTPEVQEEVLTRKRKLIDTGGQKLLVIAGIITYLSWFNPILWFSYYYMKADMRRM